MKSHYFSDKANRAKTLKFTKIPPADAQRLRFFRLSNPSIAFKKSSKGDLLINRGGLSSFRASKKRRRLPITYELKWELACEQGWKCKLCKKKLKLAAQVDHIKPLCQGGPDSKENLQVTCYISLLQKYS